MVPCDYATAGFIVDDDLYAIIKRTQCRTFLLFDSCHSGTVCDLQWSFDYQYSNYFTRNMNHSNVIANPNIFMFSGCKDEQTSADVYDSESKMYVGAFTNAFLTCLKQNKYTVQLFKMQRDICVNLANNGYTQRSIFSSSYANPTYVLSPVQKGRSLPTLTLTNNLSMPITVAEPVRMPTKIIRMM